jgi:hypothetical protein
MLNELILQPKYFSSPLLFLRNNTYMGMVLQPYILKEVCGLMTPNVTDLEATL